MSTSQIEVKEAIENVVTSNFFDRDNYPEKFTEAFEDACDEPENGLCLEALELQDEDIPYLVDFLNAHPNIKLLEISIDTITDTCARALSGNTTLTTLILKDYSISNEAIAVLALNKTLRTLEFREGPRDGTGAVGDAGAEILACNKTLKKLVLIDAQISAVGAEALARNKTLIFLNIGMNDIGDVGTMALATNTSLRSLNVDMCGIRDIGAVALANNGTLEELCISQNSIKNEGVIALAGNKSLRDLDLTGNEQISSEGIKALALNTTLRTLELESIALTDTDAAILARNKTLTKLSLASTDIGDVGAVALAGNTTLAELIIANTRIGDVGAVALANNTILKTLNVEANMNIGLNGARALFRRVQNSSVPLNLTLDKILSETDMQSILKESMFTVLQNSPYYVMNDNTEECTVACEEVETKEHQEESNAQYPSELIMSSDDAEMQCVLMQSFMMGLQVPSHFEAEVPHHGEAVTFRFGESGAVCPLVAPTAEDVEAQRAARREAVRASWLARSTLLPRKKP